MILSLKKQWLDGERVVHLAPEKQTRVDDSFLHRPYLFTGRALTDTTLVSSTKHRIRHMMLFGRQMSAGVIRGLELTPYTKTFQPQGGAPVTEQWLRLGEGLGLTVTGDDLGLAATADIFLDSVSTAGTADPARGAGIFVLEPVEVYEEVAVDAQSQCPWDRERDPLEDEQIIDGCRLVFFPWPAVLGPLPPVEGSCFRNQLAYRIFDFELDHPFGLLPWEETGLALGLTYIADDGRIAFIDRHAVVRQGGAPMSVRPMLTTNGTPFMWEARIQQLIGQLYDIKAQTADVPAARAHFEVLPPAGVLPRQILDFSGMQTSFFPSQFTVNAVPIPAEQLEVALNASAGLAPFDLQRAEKIKLLVPVPQAVFEPDLLKQEVPDPIFLETLRLLVREIRQEIAARAFLRGRAAAVVGAIDSHDVPGFPAVDPDVIPDETKFPVVLAPAPGPTDYGAVAASLIQALRDWILQNTDVSEEDLQDLDPADLGGPDFAGLTPFIETTAKRIQETEAYLSTQFVKTEAEMYRLRQLIGGAIKASRLATSPAFAGIVQGVTAQPTVADVEAYFTPAQVEEKADSVVFAKSDLTAEKMAPSRVSGKSEDDKITEALNIVKKQESGEKLNDDEVLVAASTLASILADRVGDGAKAMTMIARPDAASFEKEAALGFRPETAYLYRKYTSPTAMFEYKGERREKKIVERVYESPAMEIKSKAVLMKAEVFAALYKIPLDIDDEVTVTAADSAVLTYADYVKLAAAFKEDARSTVLENRTRKPRQFVRRAGSLVAVVVSELTQKEVDTLTTAGVSSDLIDALESALGKLKGHNRVSLKTAGLSGLIREGVFDPNPTDGDEASYFSAGVAALEHVLEAMRVVDGQLDDYRKALKKCHVCVNDLARNAKAWKDALGAIEDRLAVLRHDALVARSLFEEEKGRVAAINAYRRRILDEHVAAVAFVRPRLVEARADVPAVKLYGEYVSPVAACLAQDYEATDELEDMLDTFREVPLAWLTQTRSLLEQVPTVTHFVEIFRQAQVRAKVLLPAQIEAPQATATAYNTKEYGQAVEKVVYAHKQVKKEMYQAKSVLNVQQLAAMTWLDLNSKAREELSIADLVATGKGRSALARKAAAVLEEIEDIAVCLYNQCNALVPAIRLQWANRLSIFDAAVSLQELDVLPAWDQIDVIQRRDLQNLVDWLFQQVDPKVAKAVKMMNDLVRVCILLSGHAPVSAIVRGYAPAPAKGRIGDVIDTVIDKGTVRIGMTAAVITQNMVAVQGVVEDIAQGAARIRITHTAQQTDEFAIDQGSRIKFVNKATK